MAKGRVIILTAVMVRASLIFHDIMSITLAAETVVDILAAETISSRLQINKHKLIETLVSKLSMAIVSISLYNAIHGR
jgi:hypothetical protein